MFFLFCCVVFNTLILTACFESEPWSPQPQIPKYYRQQNLQLYLEFPEKLETREFFGRIILHFYAEEFTQLIVLHASVAEILSLKVEGDNGMIPSNFTYIPLNELLHITLEFSLTKNDLYHLHITYTGELRTDMTGLYIIPYLNEHKETDYMLSSNFKPKYARRALPCFDEPDFRSRFTIEVMHSAEYKALSNAPQNESIIAGSNSTVTTIFNPTDLISVHQLSISLMKLSSRGEEQLGIFKIHGMNTSSLMYALNVSIALVGKMTEYTKILRPKKHDIIAIPTDRNVLAIDNTGLCIYPDADIEFDDATNTFVERIKVIIDIGRGMAHYFFGACLTPANWSDLWLSDGLANWLAYNSARKVASKYNIDEFFIALEYQPALLQDSFDDVQPISVPFFMHYHEKIESIVTNPILSAKTACLIRMMEYAFGEAEFERAIQAYTRRQPMSVSGDDFLEIILNELKIPMLASYFKTWLTEKHYPIITVHRNYADGSILLKQNSVNGTESSCGWFVPFNIITASNPDFTITRLGYSFEPGTCSQNIAQSSEKRSSSDWIVINSQQVGFYRTNYDLSNWKLLINAMIENHTVIHVNNRAQLLDDAFRLAELRILSYELPLNLSLYLKNETRFAPWAAANNFFNSIRKLPWEHIEQLQFEFFIRDLTFPIYSNLGLIEQPADQATSLAVREITTYWACDSWNADCFCEAKKLFLEYILNDRPISPNIRTTILCTGIKTGSRMELELAWKKLFRSDRKIERRELIYMFGCSRDKDFLVEVLYRVFLAKEPNDHTKHERLRIVPRIIEKGKTALAAVLKVLQDHMILDILYKDSILLSTLDHVSKHIFSKNHSTLFENILGVASKSWNVPYSDHSRLLRTIEQNIDWVERNQGEISSWLQKYYLENANGTQTLLDAKEPVCDVISKPLCGCGCGCDSNAADILISHRWQFFKLIVLLVYLRCFEFRAF